MAVADREAAVNALLNVDAHGVAVAAREKTGLFNADAHGVAVREEAALLKANAYEMALVARGEAVSALFNNDAHGVAVHGSP